MEKNKLLLVFKLENFSMGIIITIISIFILITGTEILHKAMAIGMIIGGGSGIFFNHFVQIPKVYGEKDERELVLMIISVYLSVSFGFVVFSLLFILSSYIGINFSQIKNIIITTITFSIMFIIRCVVFKVLLKYL